MCLGLTDLREPFVCFLESSRHWEKERITILKEIEGKRKKKKQKEKGKRKGKRKEKSKGEGKGKRQTEKNTYSQGPETVVQNEVRLKPPTIFRVIYQYTSG